MQYMAIMEASPWWWALRRGPQGQHIIQDLLRQMLSALAVLQAANITHRYRPALMPWAATVHMQRSDFVLMKHQPQAATAHMQRPGRVHEAVALSCYCLHAESSDMIAHLHSGVFPSFS